MPDIYGRHRCNSIFITGQSPEFYFVLVQIQGPRTKVPIISYSSYIIFLQIAKTSGGTDGAIYLDYCCICTILTTSNFHLWSILQVYGLQLKRLVVQIFVAGKRQENCYYPCFAFCQQEHFLAAYTNHITRIYLPYVISFPTKLSQGDAPHPRVLKAAQQARVPTVCDPHNTLATYCCWPTSRQQCHQRITHLPRPTAMHDRRHIICSR